jgi:hypothetical protein
MTTPLRVGFTGTQRGMSGPQTSAVRRHLGQCFKFAGPDQPEFHHGDCIGADAQAAQIARDLGYRVVGHPPVVAAKRAFFPSDVERRPEAYLVRNREIVDAVEFMLATPGEAREVLRSGTWSTIRYARQRGVPGVIIRP